MCLANKPSLNESDSVFRIASVSVGTETGFKKADQMTAGVLGDEIDSGKRSIQPGRQRSVELFEIFLLRRIGP
jgi:hypothetical protein